MTIDTIVESMRLRALLLLLALGALLAALVWPQPVAAGVYNADTNVMYKEYWVPHTAEAGYNGGFSGECTHSTVVWYIEPGTFQCRKTLSVNIPAGDLAAATKAEIYIDLWRNHAQPSARFQINPPSPPQPNPNYAPAVGSPWSRTPYVGEIPLAELVAGENKIVFWNTGGRLFHAHDVAIRLYFPYSGSGATFNSIQHDSGSAAPGAGGTLLVNNDQLTFSISVPGGTQWLEVHGYYEGYDEDNDGNFHDWHNATRMNCNPGGFVGTSGCFSPLPTTGTINHIGTIANPGGTASVNWSLPHITNQSGVRFKTRSMGSDGMIRETGFTSSFTLLRDKITHAFFNPDFQDAGLHMGGANPATYTTTVQLPDSLAPYNKAYVIGAYWNNPWLRFNNANTSTRAFATGQDTWALSIGECANNTFNPCSLPLLNRLNPGTNLIEYAHPSGFGEFIEKPGPVIVLKHTTAVVPDDAPPTAQIIQPPDGAQNIEPATKVVLQLKDAGVGINRGSIVFRVNGETKTPQIRGFSNQYLLTYTPQPPFGFSATANISVDACDLKNNCMPTFSYTFSTRDEDTIPPVISNVVVTPFTASARVTWTTDKPATSRVDYGTTPAYGSNVSNLTLKTAHNLTLPSLTPGTTYHFKITSVNRDNFGASTDDATFATNVLGPASSDNFNSCEFQSDFWTFVNPLNDAALTVVDGQRLRINVPGGLNHDTEPTNGAPRLMQDATTPNNVRVKFESGPTGANRFHGLIFEQNENNYLTITIRYWAPSDETQLVVRRIVNGSPSNAIGQVTMAQGVITTPIHLAVSYNEQTFIWRVFWDFDVYKPVGFDGATGNFNHPLAVSKLGFFAGNVGGNNAPPHEVLVDFFSAPPNQLFDEDDTQALTLPTAVMPPGAGGIAKSTDCGNPVTLTAAPAAGYTFSHWSGAAAGTTAEAEAAFGFGDFAVAHFTANQYSLSTGANGNGTVTVSPNKPTYGYGEQVTLTANPSSGWSFSGWSGGLTDNPLTVTVNGNLSLDANFAQPQFSLTVNRNGDGAVTVSPQKTGYAPGEVVALTAAPAAGWSFGSWSGAATGAAPLVTLTMDGNKAVNATFTQNKYTVEVVADGSGSANPGPLQPTYHLNDILLMTAAAAPGWSFLHWGGDLISALNPANLTVAGNHFVFATFAQGQFVLTADIVGQGVVTTSPPKPGYQYGESVQLAATPSPGWQFVGWSGAVNGQANPISVTLNGDRSVTASFVQQQFPVARSALGSGGIVADPDKATYGYGEQVSFTAVPATGWTFTGWQGDLSGDTNPATLLITGTRTVVAQFADRPLTINTTIVGEGQVLRTPQQNVYSEGDVVTLTAVPDVGWQFESWGGDLTGTQNPVQVTLDTNKNITANFVQGQYALQIHVPQGGGAVQVQPPGRSYRGSGQEAYPANWQVNVTAVPDPGYLFTRWEGDLAGSALSNQVTMERSKTVSAYFAPTVYTLSTGAIGNGTLEVTPVKATYQHGDEVTLTAKPAPGWAFNGWIGVDGNTSPMVIVITRSLSITAVFTQDASRPHLTVVVNGEGQVKAKNANGNLVDPEPTYTLSSTVELVAQPAIGWTFAGWSGDSTGANITTTLLMDGNKMLTANFENNLRIRVVGVGTVQRTPNKQQFDPGDQVSLLAQPGLGWEFAGWSGSASGTDNPITITVGDDTSITATFTKKQYIVDDFVVKVGGGQIETEPDPPFTVGQSVKLTAVPDEGWTFARWEVLEGVEAAAVETTNPEIQLTIPVEKVLRAVFEWEAGGGADGPVFLPLVSR
jgi:uncharacterized repeat protein (TIGR02543 family)